MPSNKENITIVGAGLVGSLLGCFLSKQGYKVNIFERRPDYRKEEMDGNRSINLAMSVRGWTALEKVGMANRLKQIAIPMYGRKIHQADGTTNFQAYGKENEAIYSISRGELNKVLLNEADKDPNVSLHFNEKCKEIDFEESKITFTSRRNTASHFQSDVIFGADGAFSAVRYNMQKKPMFNFSQQYLDHGYKELTIPAGKDGTHVLDKNALHIWPRKSFMLIALPNLDGSFTCTLFAPFKGEYGFENLNTNMEVEAYFNKFFRSAVPHMPTLVTDFFENPTSSLVTVRCSPWNHKNTCLIGDSSHAIVPFYGQGMNSGFEDCSVLFDILEENKEQSWNDILSSFSAKRTQNADAIADLALRNFIEMRDSTADDNFLMRKKLEHFLTDEFPDKFQSQYRMVTFSNIDYHTALTLGDAQTAFLETLLNDYPRPENWQDAAMLKKVEAWLEENV